MESDYPDGLPAVSSSGVGSYPYDPQANSRLSEYAGHGGFSATFFLQQSASETFDGTGIRNYQSQHSQVLQDPSQTLGSPSFVDNYHQFSSPYQQPAWLASPAYTEEPDSCSSQSPSAAACGSRTVINCQQTAWKQSPELAQGSRYHSGAGAMRAAMEERRFHPTSSSIADYPAFDFSESGYRLSTSHPSYMQQPLFDGLPAAASLSPPSTLPLLDNTMSRDNTAPLSEYGENGRRHHSDIKSPSMLPAVVQKTISGGAATKEQEPYAQLIYRAFMSHPRHAMTLQEIYQWFRENTDKAKGAGKGWQNSIRHNLSMNKAFQKQEKKFDGNLDGKQRGDGHSSGDNKKSSEWYLIDWAVDGGVQSTTRYRKGNSSRRTVSGRQSSQATGPGGSNSTSNSSARRSAGRQGGVAASRTKESHRRRQMQDTQRASTSAPTVGLGFGGLNSRPAGGGEGSSGGVFGAFSTVPLDHHQNGHATRDSAAANAAGGPQGFDQSYLGLGQGEGEGEDTPTVKSEDEPVTPEVNDVRVPYNTSSTYTYEVPQSTIDRSAYTLEDVVGLYGGSPSSSSRAAPLFSDPNDVAENLRFLSGYPSSTCAWLDTDMGNSDLDCQ